MMVTVLPLVAVVVVLVLHFVTVASGSWSWDGVTVDTPCGFVLSLEYHDDGAGAGAGAGARGGAAAEVAGVDVEFYYLSDDILRVKMVDSSKSRYQVPYVYKISECVAKPANMTYSVTWVSSPFGFTVRRQDSDEIVFCSSDEGMPILSYSDQYLSISTTLDPSASLYGLPERFDNVLITRGKNYTLWNQAPM
ncbi:hypothetical protein Pelo_1838 [Pelomyxa schiedti]|nr:hypothetical protein Pelo_1838 [Pelomyxa schiedti]